MRLVFATLGAKFAQQCRQRGNLDLSRGSACPVLSGLRNILPPLLNEFVAPVLELLGDDFDAAGIFNGVHFDSSGVVITRTGFRQLQDGVDGRRIDAFTKFVKDLNSVQ